MDTDFAGVDAGLFLAEFCQYMDGGQRITFTVRANTPRLSQPETAVTEFFSSLSGEDVARIIFAGGVVVFALVL